LQWLTHGHGNVSAGPGGRSWEFHWNFWRAGSRRDFQLVFPGKFYFGWNPPRLGFHNNIKWLSLAGTAWFRAKSGL
jgi:hypothetical protein